MMMPGGDSRKLLRIFRRTMAAPHNVQIRAHEQELVTVDVTRMLLFDVEHMQRRTGCTQCPFERRRIPSSSPQAQERIALAQLVVQCAAVPQPHVRQSRPWPG